MPVLYLLCGLPCSGKTTWISSITGAVVVSPDRDLAYDGAYRWTPERLARAWAVSWQYYGRALAGRRDVVFDATLLDQIARAPVLGVALGADYDVEIHSFVCDPVTRRDRNLSRPPERRVPDATLSAMERRWQPPTLDEALGSPHVTIHTHDTSEAP